MNLYYGFTAKDLLFVIALFWQTNSVQKCSQFLRFNMWPSSWQQWCK